MSIGVILPIIVLAIPLRWGLASSSTSSWSRRLGARDYAESHALNYNNNYVHFDEDCTNFMSIALHEGGQYPMQYDVPKWYSLGVWHTLSWTVVGDLVNFVNARNWGYSYHTSPGTYNSAQYGDIILYDWNSDGSWDHASMEVIYNGCDPVKGWCGDLVDAHTVNHKHAFWTLQPYNNYWQTTSYGILHIDY